MRLHPQEGGDAGIHLRGLFIIDGKGIMRCSMINDLPVGRNPDEVLRLVQAFQFTGQAPIPRCVSTYIACMQAPLHTCITAYMHFAYIPYVF